MIKTKSLLMIFGIMLSLILLAVFLWRLDWEAFRKALQNVQLSFVIASAFAVSISVGLRALRWNLVAHSPLRDYRFYWRAVNIGYLGNLIYPARAGEFMRIAALHHFLPLGLGRAITSAVLDRMLDVVALGLFVFLLIGMHGNHIFKEQTTFWFSLFFVGFCCSLLLMIVYGKSWHERLKTWEPPAHSRIRYRLRLWFLHVLESFQAFRQLRSFLWIFLLNLLCFGIDCFVMLLCFYAFGWDIPLSAAITVAVFIVVGASLPSAPGYIGVYQAACVLALSFYGIAKADALAYSFIVQLTCWLVAGAQGSWVSLHYGFKLSRHSGEAQSVASLNK